jgi:hypothetical protein
MQPLSPVPRRPERARSVRERRGKPWREVAPVGCTCPGEQACHCERAGQEAAISTFASHDSGRTAVEIPGCHPELAGALVGIGTSPAGTGPVSLLQSWPGPHAGAESAISDPEMAVAQEPVSITVPNAVTFRLAAGGLRDNLGDVVRFWVSPSPGPLSPLLSLASGPNPVRGDQDGPVGPCGGFGTVWPSGCRSCGSQQPFFLAPPRRRPVHTARVRAVLSAGRARLSTMQFHLISRYYSHRLSGQGQAGHRN